MIRPRKLLISRSKTPPTINTNGTFNYFKRALYASLTRICVYEITVIFDSAHRIQIELIRFPTFGNHRRERENEFTTQARKKSKKRPNRRRKLRSTAYKNGDLRDKNSTNTCVKIEARYPPPLSYFIFHYPPDPRLFRAAIFQPTLPSKYLEIFLYSARRAFLDDLDLSL